MPKKEPDLEEKRKTKGESIEHTVERSLTGESDILKNNPYKTPPNNLTSKNSPLEGKG